MGINLREYQGVLNAKNDNRYKYTVKKICGSRQAYYKILTEEEKNKLGLSCDNDVAVVYGAKWFFSEVTNTSGLFNSGIVRASVNKFYMDTLSDFIENGISLLVSPNYEGEGKVVSAKAFKIDLFKELWEGEQEKWVFN